MVDEPLDVVYELRQRRYIAAKLRRWQLNLQRIQENAPHCNGNSLKSSSAVVSSSSRWLRQSSVESTSSCHSTSRPRDLIRPRDRNTGRGSETSHLSSRSLVCSTLPSRLHNSSLTSSYSTLPASTHKQHSSNKPARSRSDNRPHFSHISTQTQPVDHISPVSLSSEDRIISRKLGRRSSSQTAEPVFLPNQRVASHTDQTMSSPSDKTVSSPSDKTVSSCDGLAAVTRVGAGIPISISMINSVAPPSAVGLSMNLHITCNRLRPAQRFEAC